MITVEKVKPALISVGYYTSPRGGSPSPHAIAAGQILFELITGGGVYGPAGDTLHGPGWVFAHGPGDSTVWRSEPGGHYECMTAGFELASVTRPESWPRSFDWGDPAGAETFAHEVLHAFHHTDVDRGILGDLVWSRLRFQLDAFRRREERSEIPPRLSEVLTYIDRHLTDPLGIDDLAAHVGLSAPHLHARFKEYVGTTPHQYVIRSRLQEARHRLATSTAPIKAIAADIGYANTESFCRAFKTHFNTTAAAYRRKYMIYT